MTNGDGVARSIRRAKQFGDRHPRRGPFEKDNGSVQPGLFYGGLSKLHRDELREFGRKAGHLAVPIALECLAVEEGPGIRYAKQAVQALQDDSFSSR